MRLNYEQLKVSEWTVEEAFDHLTRTFDRECKIHPAIMEPYMIQLAGEPSEGQTQIMRRALRETVSKRYDQPQAGE